MGPQALEFNRKEKFNIELFRECGKLGLPGVSYYHILQMFPGTFNIFGCNE